MNSHHLLAPLPEGSPAIEVDRRSDVPDAALAELTVSPEKRAAYRLDPYFRSGLREIGTAVHDRAIALLKSDAVVGRRLSAAVQEFTGGGFCVVGATTFRFSPLLIRELWRYQFNIASWERAEIVDLLLPATPTLLLVLEDEQWSAGAVPASCRLSDAKGPSDPRRRGPTDLRTTLRSPSTLLNFIHTADEPADVVRELALLCLAGGIHPASVWPADRSSAVPTADVAHRIAVLESRTVSHDLDATASWRRLRRRAAGARTPLGRQAGTGPAPHWSALLDLFPARQPPAGLLWDVLTIACDQVESNVPGLVPVVPSIRAWQWRADGDGAVA